jgi:hypothetical protein
VGTWEFNKKDSIYAFDGKTRKNLWKKPVHDWMYHGTSIADFDDDKKPELLIGSWNDTLYCINGEDGTTDWKYFAGGSAISCPISLGDIDNDGKCDIVFTSWYKVIALSDKGKLKWQYNIPSYAYNFRGVVMSDINNDAYPDVIFGTYAGELLALNGNDGTQIFRMDIAAHYGDSKFDINHAPVISDFDGDSTLDAFFVGGYGVSSPTIVENFGRAYMVSIGKGNGPDWLMFQRDIRRQSSMCFDYLSSEELSPENNYGISIYPNPSTSTFELSCEEAGLNISIFDLHGKKVFEKINADKTETIDLGRKGIFVVKISKNSITSFKKVIIL